MVENSTDPVALCPYLDEYGRHVGFCNACGEEADQGTHCCDDGEVVLYEDDPCEES